MVSELNFLQKEHRFRKLYRIVYRSKLETAWSGYLGYLPCFTNEIIVGDVAVHDLEAKLRGIVRDSEDEGFVPFRVTSCS